MENLIEKRKALKIAVSKMVETEKFESDLQYMYMLKARWSDEKGFEDFKTYINAAKKTVESFKVTGLSKGFTLTGTLNGQRIQVKLMAAKWRVIY